MKTLKKRSSGLIFYEDFSNTTINEQIKINGVFNKVNKVLYKGELYFDIFNYPNFVLQVVNSYIPANINDYGGIFLRKDNGEAINFVEYYEEPLQQIPYVRIIRKNNNYIGKGSNDGLNWFYRGDAFLCPATQAGIFVTGNTAYNINSISLFKDEYITVYNVRNGWKLFVNDVYTVSAYNGQIKAILPYPFNGNLKIYNENDELVCNSNIINGWGGDEYECTINVDIIDPDSQSLLNVEDLIHLGELQNGFILRQYILKNNDTEEVSFTVKIAEYSPFYDWVWLLSEEPNTLYYDNGEKSLNYVLSGLEEKNVFVYIKKPPITIEYDYRNKECVFFLELE